jgi:hypothetical protein
MQKALVAQVDAVSFLFSNFLGNQAQTTRGR